MYCRLAYELLHLIVMTARILADYKAFNINPVKGISFKMNEKDMKKWTGTLLGPAGSPYEGGMWDLRIEFTEDYPFKAPKVLFTTPIYHPCIDKNGKFCIPILNEQWNVGYTVVDIFKELLKMLTEALAIRSGESTEIVMEIVNKPDDFVKHAKEHTKKHAA